MTNSTQNDLDIELVDLDLSTIEDLAGFEVPPEGRYIANLSLAIKDINGTDSIEFKYKVVENLSLVDPEAILLPNASFSHATGLDQAKLAFVKKKCLILAEALQIPANVRSLVENVQNLQVEVTLRHRKGKKKSEDEPAPIYADVKDEGYTIVG